MNQTDETGKKEIIATYDPAQEILTLTGDISEKLINESDSTVRCSYTSKQGEATYSISPSDCPRIVNSFRTFFAKHGRTLVDRTSED